MKKLLLLVIPVLLLTLTGCNKAESEDKEQQDNKSSEQDSKKYDTSDEHVRDIMKKDPSKLNDKELAIYNEVNSQINNKAELSETDKAIKADQRAMSEKRNAKSEFEQARIDEQTKQAQQDKQESEYEGKEYIPHGHTEEFREIQNSTDRELSQGELIEEYERRNQEPQTQQVQQEPQTQETQQTQQEPQTQQNQNTEKSVTEHADQEYKTEEK